MILSGRDVRQSLENLDQISICWRVWRELSCISHSNGSDVWNSDVKLSRRSSSTAFVNFSLNCCKGLMVSHFEETQRNDVTKLNDDKTISSIGDTVV